MQSFMTTLFTSSVSMSVLTLIYMAATPLLEKKYSSKGRYYTWLIIVIGLMIPFRPKFDCSFIKLAPINVTTPNFQVGNNTTFSGVVENALSTNNVTTMSVSWWQIGGMVWLVGMAAFFTYYGIKHYRFLKMTKRWRELITDNKTLSLLQDLKAEFGIVKQMELYHCSSIGTPMLIGILTPKILLPNMDFSKEELRFILSHELVHYKRKDLWYWCMVLLAKTIHWFNPLVYVMTKAIDELCEISCDGEVMRNTNKDMRLQYSETIIGVMQYQSKMKTVLSTNFYGGKKGMKKRIFSIMDTSRKKAGAGVFGTVLILTLGAGAVFSVNAAARTEPDNVPITNVATADANQKEQDIKWEPLPGYEQFGISYDENENMLFHGQLVRYFWDGYEMEPYISATRYDYLNEAGVVDVYTIRSVIDNGDGSVDHFGELLNIAAYSQQGFEARDVEWLKGNGGNPGVTSVFGESSDTGRRTFAEIFSDYKNDDMEYDPTVAGLGNLYYQGQLVKTFVDEKNDGSIFTFQSTDGGDTIVWVIYDENGNRTGFQVEHVRDS